MLLSHSTLLLQNTVVTESLSNITIFSNFQRVQNKEVYIFRLSEANNAGINERPKYFKLYDAKDDLELSSLFPKDFDQAVKRLATDDEYYSKYFRSV